MMILFEKQKQCICVFIFLCCTSYIKRSKTLTEGVSNLNFNKLKLHEWMCTVSPLSCVCLHHSICLVSRCEVNLGRTRAFSPPAVKSVTAAAFQLAPSSSAFSVFTLTQPFINWLANQPSNLLLCLSTRENVKCQLLLPSCLTRLPSMPFIPLFSPFTNQTNWKALAPPLTAANHGNRNLSLSPSAGPDAGRVRAGVTSSVHRLVWFSHIGYWSAITLVKSLA